MELDTHADTCALGGVSRVLQDTGRVVSVEGFGEAVGQLSDVNIVTAAVAYDCPRTFHTYLLIFNEALYVAEMQTHLLNPAQMRAQGIIVNDVPLQHLPQEQRTLQSHSIISEDPPLHIPLTLRGTMSGFTIRMPTWREIRDTATQNVTVIHMTNAAPWDPHAIHYSKIEGTL